MTYDETELTAYLVHPDTNIATFKSLVDQAMEDPEYTATMKVLTVVLREDRP